MDKYIKTPSIITISGANGSGKTNFIKYFIKTMNSFDYVLIFSNTAAFNKDYNIVLQNTDHLIIHPTKYKAALEMFMNLQKKYILSGVENKCLIIFDDIMGSIKDCDVIKQLISQNRHFLCTIIFSIQHINQAATYLREVSLYDIIFDLKTENSLKACYNNYYISDYSTFKEFRVEINKLLKRYHFILSDRLNSTKTIMLAPLI